MLPIDPKALFAGSFDDVSRSSLDPNVPSEQQVRLSLATAFAFDDDTSERVREARPRQLVREAPSTAKAIVSADSAIAVEDYEHLSLIERFMRDLRQRGRLGSSNLALGQLGFDALLAGDVDDVREGRIAELRDIQAQNQRDFGIPRRGALGFIASTPGAVLETLPIAGHAIVSGIQGAGVGAAGGAVTGLGAGGIGAGPGALVGARVGSALGSTFATVEVEGGLAFLELREIEGDDGKPIPLEVARSLALGVGVVNGLIERFGLSRVLGDAPVVGKVLNSFSLDTAKQLAQNAAFRRIAASAARGATIEGVTEMAQELVSATAELIAEGGDLEAIEHAGLTGAPALWARVLAAGKQGAQAGAGLSAGATATRTLIDSERAQFAREASQKLSGLVKESVNSKLRKEAPEAFKAMVRDAADRSTGSEFVYVSAPAMQAWINEADSSSVDSLIRAVPGIRAQIDESAATGADIQIAIEDYLAHIAAESVGQAIAQDVRTDPADMTEREAIEFLESLKNRESKQFLDGEIESDANLGEGVDALEGDAFEFVETKGQLRQIARFAKEVVSDTQFRALQPHKYRVAAARENRLAIEAANRGDKSLAEAHKRRAAFSAKLESEARKAKEETQKSVRSINRAQTGKTIETIAKAGADYLEEYETLLARFDLHLSKSLKDIDRKNSLAQWIADREAEGDVVVIPPSLRNDAFKRSWKEMSVAEIRDLRDSLKNIEHLARLKTGLVQGQSQRAMESARAELIEEALANTPVDNTPRRLGGEKPRLDFWGIESAFRKMEFLIDDLDGGKPVGAWRKLVFDPVAQAEARRNKLNEKYTIALAQSMGVYLRQQDAGFNSDFVMRPELGIETTKSALVAMALNVGNESNMEKLSGGLGVSSEAIMRLLDRELSDTDWAFAQNMWDTINSLWPLIEAQEKRLTGVAPAKVEAREVVTRHGRFRGGYYPVVYDPDQSYTQFKHQSKGLFEGIENHFQRAITGHGHTIERTKVVGPLLLDLAVIPGHLDKVIHDLTHREVLSQIDRMLDSPEVHEAVSRTAGKAAAEMFRPWLQSIAQDRVVEQRGLVPLSRLLRTVRANVTSYTLGLRATTLITQTLGHANAVAELKRRLPNWKNYYGRGIRGAWSGLDPKRMQESFDRVAALSGEMKHRASQIDRDLRDVIRRNAAEIDVGPVVTRASMEAIGKVQMYSVDLPVWIASYEGSQAELGLTEDEAISFADSVVRMSQGGAGAKDLSALQRGDEGIKQFLLFFSYRNTLYNQVRGDIRQLRQTKDVPAFLAAHSLRILVPAVGAALIRADFPDEDEWIEWTSRHAASELLGVLPFVEWPGIVQEITGYGPSFSGGNTPPQRLADTFRDALDPEDPAESFFDVVRLAALWRGLPLDAITKKLEPDE